MPTRKLTFLALRLRFRTGGGMKKALSAVTIYVLLAFSLALPSFSSRIFAIAEGTVKSEKGDPIKGAKVVFIFSEDETKSEVETDEKGRWRESNLKPGLYTIGFFAEGYKPLNLTVQLSAIKDNKPIEIVLARIPESPFAGADALYEKGNYAEALSGYQKVLAENPQLIQAYEKIGLCYYHLDDKEKALDAFKMALEKDAQSVTALINLSAIYLEKGDLKEGLRYYEQIGEEKIKDPGFFYNLGALFFKNGQVDLAISNFLKCLTLDPKYVNAYYQVGLAQLNKGIIEEARSNLQKVIEIAPDSEKASLARKILESLK
jgi:tetratricopeptide (TPR) repeat protein